MAAPRSFPLQVRWGGLLGGLVLFGGGALFLAWRASTNDRGLILNGLIEFGTDGATKFYLVMAVLSLLMTLMSVIAMIRALGGSQVVTVEDDAVTIPGTLLYRAHRIPYASITALERATFGGHALLRVRHAAGSSAVGAGQVGEAAFREIVELITAAAARSSPAARPDP